MRKQATEPEECLLRSSRNSRNSRTSPGLRGVSFAEVVEEDGEPDASGPASRTDVRNQTPHHLLTDFADLLPHLVMEP